MNIVLAAVAAAAVTWQPALPGYTFHFPADYGAHESSRDEWWYYTGNLRDARGHRYGFELTFFRVGIQPRLPGGSPWDIDDLYFSHFAVTDTAGGTYYHVDQTGRGALGEAGAATGDERVWLDRSSARRSAGGRHALQARADDFALHLTLSPRKPAVLNGRDGVSRKGSCRGCASHYYSFTDLSQRRALVAVGKRTRHRHCLERPRVGIRRSRARRRRMGLVLSTARRRSRAHALHAAARRRQCDSREQRHVGG